MITKSRRYLHDPLQGQAISWKVTDGIDERRQRNFTVYCGPPCEVIASEPVKDGVTVLCLQ